MGYGLRFCTEDAIVKCPHVVGRGKTTVMCHFIEGETEYEPESVLIGTSCLRGSGEVGWTIKTQTPN